ncbi:MAG TPA: hypothetical protein DF613_10845 [Lachnospiraceae bacterium]|nr:hypothetical protein [Lachnospiraceae bacterium]
MTALDEMISGDSLQMMKAAVPYMSPRAAGFLAVFAKMQELQNTVRLYRQVNTAGLQAMSADRPQPSPTELLNELRQYTGAQGQQAISSIQQLIDTMQLIQMFQESGTVPPAEVQP